jgi:hypothetical protein
VRDGRQAVGFLYDLQPDVLKENRPPGIAWPNTGSTPLILGYRRAAEIRFAKIRESAGPAGDEVLACGYIAAAQKKREAARPQG